MKDTILWDNDGVLVDTEKLYYQATREVMGAEGYELNRDEYVEYFLLQGNGAWHLMGLDDEQIAALRRVRNDRYSELLSEGVTVIDGVRRALESLSDHYKMGIVTSSRRDHFDIIHTDTGLLDYFEFVVTSEDASETKPSPAPYLKGLEMAERHAEQCMVVEDSARGLLAASRAGIDCCVIPTSWTGGSDFNLATHNLASADDLIPILMTEAEKN